MHTANQQPVMQQVETSSETGVAAFTSRVYATRERINQTEEQRAVSLFALVDTRSVPELRSALNRLESIPFVALWDGTDLATHENVSPLLIELGLDAEDGDTAQALLKRLWEFSVHGFSVTWIWSFHELTTVAMHLQSYCEYTLPDRSTFYLHFGDNRILERLRKIWTTDEWSRFASVAHEIWYRQRSGESVSWGSDADASHAITAEPLVMTDDQHRALLEMGYADKAAMELRGVLGTNVNMFSADQLHRAVADQIERATAHGITEEPAVLRYAAFGLLYSPNFDEHPEVRKLLQSARYGDVPLARALSEIGAIAGAGATDGRADQ